VLCLDLSHRSHLAGTPHGFFVHVHSNPAHAIYPYALPKGVPTKFRTDRTPLLSSGVPEKPDFEEDANTALTSLLKHRKGKMEAEVKCASTRSRIWL
jgi:hypothetical protein